MYQFVIWIDYMYFILFGRFFFLACKVYGAFMGGSHNILVNVKLTKNVGGISCFIITNKIFHKSFK